MHRFAYFTITYEYELKCQGKTFITKNELERPYELTNKKCININYYLCNT